MMKFLRALGLVLLLPNFAAAQPVGQLPAGYVWGNSTSARAPAAPASISAMFDRALSGTQGALATRNAAGWIALAPGTAGLPLLSGGAGANLAYGIPALAAGGTGANLTASTGGIFYSGASAGAILAGTATARQMVQSGAGAAPAWSTTTWPATSAAGTIIASLTANTVTATAAPVLGASGTPGSITFGNATSGLVTLQTVTGALGTVTASLPANTGTVAETNLAQSWSGLQTFTSGVTINSSFTATGLIALTNLATQTANTILVNATSGAASPTAQAVPSCSGAGNALNWTTSTGIGCNSSITAAAVPASGLTGSTLAAGVTGSSLTGVGILTTGSTGAGFTVAFGSSTFTGSLPCANHPALTGDVTTSLCAATLATAQPAVHTWALAQTFTVAPVFTDQAGSRTALGLGTAATVNTGTSGATIPLMNATNTWAGTNNFSQITALGLSFGGQVMSTYTATTWTPTITTSGTTGTPAYSIQVGSYEQIGRLVVVRFSITLSGWTGSPTGNVQISGLPVASANTVNNNGGCLFNSYGVAGLAALNYGLVGFISPNTQFIVIQQNGNAGTTPLTAAQAGAIPSLFGWCQYNT